MHDLMVVGMVLKALTLVLPLVVVSAYLGTAVLWSDSVLMRRASAVGVPVFLLITYYLLLKQS